VLLLRVRMLNRPEALGAIASALGAIGADINLVEIIEKRGDVEIDEFILDLPTHQTVASLVAACERLPRVQVLWVRNYPRGGGIDLDVELYRRMAADSARAVETLALAAPLVFRAEWSLLLQVSGAPRVTFRSPGAPDLSPDSAQRFTPFDSIHRVALESDWLPGWESHHAVVAPISEQQVLIIGRRGDPAFFASELARLAHLIGRADTPEIPEQALSTTTHTGHRTPIAAPLYIREDPPPPASTPEPE
jgi:hypothetical protein